MSQVIKIKKGLDINLVGNANLSVRNISSNCFALQPTDFLGVLPKLLVEEGEVVKAGSPLFYDKHNEKVIFTSPVSGTISEIRRGEKRLLEAIVIHSDNKFESIDFGIGKLDKESIKQKLLECGLWPVIRQRPFSVIANPDDQPKAFFISAFDSSPLAPDVDFVIEHFPDSFQKGLDVLSILCDGKLHLSIHEEKTKSDAFLKAKNVHLHTFSGPHPSGNLGTQINKIDPINKGEIVWYCSPQDVVSIGRLYNTGKLDTSRIFAFAGQQVKNPGYIRTRIGAQVKDFVHDNLCEGKTRIISGNVLTGKKISEDGFVGFYDNMVTAIPEGDYYEMFGWIWPGFRKFSFSRSFPSTFLPQFLKPNYALDTNTHGEERPFVITGEFEKVFPLDIYPMQLIKACIVEDIDLMENLGIYEVDEEDFALCEFIDPSKTEIQSIIRKGLDLVRKETL